MRISFPVKNLVYLIVFSALQLLTLLFVGCSRSPEQREILLTSTASSNPSSEIIEPSPVTTTTNEPVAVIPTEISEPMPEPGELTSTAVVVTEPSLFNLVTLSEERTTTQAWRFSLDKDEWLQLGQFSTSVEQSENLVVPPEEIKAMELFLKSEGIITPINELSPVAYIAQTALSPTHEKLTIVEIDRYTFDNFPHNSFGVWRLINLHLETDVSKVLLQLPLEWGETSLSDLSWSPDGQFVALVQYKKNEANTLILIDERTGENQSLSSEIDLQGPLIWSPNSRVVAFSLSRWNITADGGVIRFCTIASGLCEDIQLESLWLYQSQYRNLDWSPDGRSVAFAAVSKDPNLAVDLLPKLYVLNVETKAVNELELDLDKVLKHPRWSPDGRYIAADYSERVDAQSQIVIILDSISRQVINQLSLPTGWMWGQDSRTIQRLNGQFPDQIEIIDIFDGSKKTISLPNNLHGNMIGFSSLSQ